MTGSIVLFLLGAYICAFNAYVSFLRYALLRLMGRPRASINDVSPITMLGSLLVGLALLGLWHQSAWRWTGLTLIVLDTGGVHWFAATMCYVFLTERRNPSEDSGPREPNRADATEQDSHRNQ